MLHNMSPPGLLLHLHHLQDLLAQRLPGTLRQEFGGVAVAVHGAAISAQDQQRAQQMGLGIQKDGDENYIFHGETYIFTVLADD